MGCISTRKFRSTNLQVSACPSPPLFVLVILSSLWIFPEALSLLVAMSMLFPHSDIGVYILAFSAITHITRTRLLLLRFIQHPEQHSNTRSSQFSKQMCAFNTFRFNLFQSSFTYVANVNLTGGLWMLFVLHCMCDSAEPAAYCSCAWDKTSSLCLHQWNHWCSLVAPHDAVHIHIRNKLRFNGCGF